MKTMLVALLRMPLLVVDAAAQRAGGGGGAGGAGGAGRAAGAAQTPQQAAAANPRTIDGIDTVWLEVDPLRSPTCSGEMRIVAFITERV